MEGKLKDLHDEAERIKASVSHCNFYDKSCYENAINSRKIQIEAERLTNEQYYRDSSNAMQKLLDDYQAEKNREFPIQVEVTEDDEEMNHDSDVETFSVSIESGMVTLKV